MGDILTIKGDYLNLLHGIIFADKDTVREDKFIAHDRYTIQVAIPAEAKSGKFILTDLAETPTELESEDAITINLPTTSNVSNETPKAGQTITITGVSLNQIAAVKLNGAELTADDLTISEDGKSLSFVVPATATDGEITLITKSGVSIPAGEIETVVPTELSVAPTPIKNGATITISGKDLDLVTGIQFPNTESSAPATVNATTVTAVVPVKAQEGDITLSLANGKTVTVAYTLVKPTVTSFSPETLMAGNKVMIKGTDLDLVESVTFPGETPVTASEEDTKITATAIGTVIPTAAVGSGCTLNLKNGTTVSVTGLTITAATDPVLSETAEGVIGEYVTIKGKNFNNAEQIYIGTTKVTKIKSRSNEEITFQIPTTIEKGEYTIYFYGTDDTKYTGGTIKANPAEVTIWEGSFNNGEWAGNQDLAWGGYDWSKVKVGQVLTFYCTANDPDPQKWCCVILKYPATNWPALDDTSQLNGNGSTTVLKYTITETALEHLQNDNGLVIQGYEMTITKITLK